MDLHAERRRSELGLALGVLVLGVAISAAGAWRLHREIEVRASDEFKRSASRAMDEVRLRFSRTVYGLNGVKGMYAANDNTNRAQFRAYVQSRDLAQEFPGVRGFGLIQRVSRSDLDSWTAAERAVGAPDFSVRQLADSDHDDLLVIRFIEPAAQNIGATGLDVGSEPVRRKGAERAIDTGEPALSGNIVLVQDSQRSSGSLLYVPIYRNGPQPTNTAERRAALLGLLYAPIVLSELLDGIPDLQAGRLALSLFDASDLATPIYQGGPSAVPPLPDSARGEPRFATRTSVTVSGRDLVMQLHSTPAFEADIDHYPASLLLLGGTLVSLLLSLLMWQQTSGRRRAERLAHSMTQDLERLAQVVRHTANAVSITDPQLRIRWINEGFTRITGYEREEAIGKTPGELLSSGRADPKALKSLADSARSATSCRAEILNRRKDGREYWIDTEIQPMLDASGRLTGFMEIGSDITDRRLAEQALDRERSTLTNILEGTNAGTWEWNVQTGETRVNARWAQIAGYTLDESDFTQIGAWHALIHPDDRQRSRALVQQHFDGRLPGYECESRIRHKSGKWVWVLGRGKLISRTDDGQPLWVAGIHLDITARKQAEFALRANENLMRMVTENIGGRLSYFDAQRKLRFANQATYDFFGGSAQDCVGKDLAELLGAEYMVRVGPAIALALQGKSQSYESEMRAPDGQKIYSVVHLLPEMREGQVHGVIAMSIDVTVAKRAEAQARRADQLMRAAIDATEAAFVLYDPDDRLVFCNDKYREYYSAVADQIEPGVTFEHLIRTAAERGREPHALGREDAWIAERLASHRSGASTINQRLMDGRTLRIVERRMPDGHTVGFRIDITELVQATDAAQAGSRAKSQFLANMSHEIRTPMNAILGLLSLLRKTRLDTRQSDYVVKTENAARSLMGLLNDILDVSKVEAGKLALDPQPFVVDDMLRDLSVILATTVGERPLELLFDIDPGVPAVLVGDAMRLQQILINLGGNAIKFTPRGEVVLRIRVVARSGPRLQLQLEVQDSGIGIAPEHHQHIFSGFSQAEASTTRRFGGTGLGLAISSRLVDMMGGRLELQSQLDQGSRFHFTIAIEAGADATAAPAQAMDRPMGQALRVLLVDDHAAALALLQRQAQSLGWSVGIAASARQALAMVSEASARGNPWQVVLMDWQLPDMDGWQACQRIRGMGGLARTTLVLTGTDWAREQLAQRSQQEEALFNGFLVKPLVVSMLRDGVLQARTDNLLLASGGPALQARAQRLQGMQVLVAEDNITNQQVVRELLEAEGAQVRIVADGAAAVQAVEHQDGAAIDVLLLDLQMPVMDGFTATSLIRTRLAQTTLPIIAMTANAMASDREACLAAGMNDHVGKPFDLDHLVRVLQRHVRRGALALQEPQAESGPGGLAPAIWLAADAAGVDIAGALRRLGGRRDIYLRLVRNLMTELQAAPGQLHHASEQADPRAATMLLHGLRGPVTSLGALPLAEVLAAAQAQLEPGSDRAAMQRAISPALAAISDIQVGLSELARALDSDPPVPAGPPAPQMDDGELRCTLELLVRQLRDSDMAATDTIANLRRRRDPANHMQLRGLDAAVDALDFDAALRLSASWLDGLCA